MIKGGPKIINDGLVLCLDAHDAKSYAGEPANNLNSDTNDYTGTSYSNMGEWTSDPTRLSKSYDSTIKTPIGTGATLIQESGTAGYHHLSRMGGSGTGNYTISFYFKPVTNDISDLRICMLGDGSTYIKFDFTQSTPTVTQGGAALSGKLAMLEALNDGWYFCAGDFNGRSGGWVGCIGYSPQSSYTGTSGNKKAYICGLNYNGLAYAVPSFDRSAVDGWKDRTANSYDGTLVSMTGTGASHYRDGQVIMPVSNSYLEFDGTDDYIDLGTTAGNFGTDPFTVSVWLNFDALGSFYNKYAADQDQILFSYSGGKPYFIYNAPNGTDYGYTVSNTSLATGTWYNLVATVDRSSDFPVIYVNGVNDGSSLQSSAGSPTTANMDNSGNLRIGRGLYSGSYSYFNGKMAQLLVYKGKALTAAEVLSNYNATKSRF